MDIEQYDNENPTKYLRGLLRDEIDPVAERAFASYIGVVPSSPVGFENFTSLVNSYMEKPPFNFPNPLTFLGGGKRVQNHINRIYCILKFFLLLINSRLERRPLIYTMLFTCMPKL